MDIVNENRPTPRCRHLETHHFAIQSWRENKEMVKRHWPGTINCSDDLTKALAFSLHYRHARRNMGHYGDTLTPDSKASIPLLESGEGIKAGEGVRARVDDVAERASPMS